MSSVIPQWYDNDVAWQQVISAHDKPITAVAYLPDGRRVATGSRDGFVKVWNVENGRQEGASMKHEGIVICLAVTRDGTKIMVSTSDEDAEVKVWDVESHELVETYSTTSPLFAISPNDRLLAVSDEDVDICTMMEGRQVNQSSVEVGKFTWSTPFSPKGKKLACGTDDDVRVYDVDSGKLILGPLEGHEEWVNCVLWSRDGSRLFSASNDGTIRCWNSDAGTQIGQPWTGHTGHIRSLSLSPDGYIIASASEDHTVRFWDGTSGRPIGQHLKHADIVTAVCFSPSGEFVASAGWDGKIYFWPAPSPQSVKDWESPAVPNLSPAALPGLKRGFDPLYLPPPPRHIPPPALQHSYSVYESAPTLEGQSQMSILAIKFPPPPDLTHHIRRIKTQYSAGGSFGDVYRCRYHGGSVPKEVAVKAFRFNFTIERNASNKSIKMLHRELGIWRRLEHDNIVPFLGIAYGFGMDSTMSLVSLWMPNESLHKFLEKYDDNLGVVHRLQFLLDIANGLHYLHSFPMIHGDLNCNNVLLDADYTARLADFGYASLVGNIPEALSYLQRSTARPGSLRWIAPEQIDPDESSNVRTIKSDIYSFGCVALQVLSGKQPWSEVREDAAVVLRLAKGQKPGRPGSRTIDDSHWNLIQECWSPVEERPTTKTIIATIQRFLSRCTQLPPLCDWLVSESSRFDSLADALSSSSLSQGAVEDSRRNVDILDKDNDNQKRPYRALSERTSHNTSTYPRVTDSLSLSGAPPYSEFPSDAYRGGIYAEHPQKRQRSMYGADEE